MTSTRITPRQLFITLTATAALVLPGMTTAAAESAKTSCLDKFQDHIEAAVTGPATPGFIPNREATICGHTASLTDFEAIHQTGIDQGLTFNQAIQDYADQDAFVELANGLKQRYPDEYAGAEYVPGGTSWIAFRGQAPASVDIPSHLDVDVIAERGFSEAELNEQLETQFDVMTDLAEVDGGMGFIDITAGSVHMELQPADGFSTEQTEQAVVDATATRLRTATVPVDVDVIATDAGAPQQGSLRGGGNLIRAGGVDHCSTAFGVRGGTLNGLLTAYHCSTGWDSTPPTHRSLDYEFWRGDGVEATLYFVEANEPDVSGFGGEVAWYGSADRPSSSWFNVTDSTFMSASGTAEVVLGQSVQFYGQTTGRSSSTVMLPSTCIQYRGYPTFCSMALAEDYISGGGDSGGAWFTGETALGVHSGYWSHGGASRSAFSKIEPALEYLDLTLLTS
ncbi:hypothetical protein [Glycomyces tritici]|uniref:Peptidase S1 domain-containing protein n=1 Tax=Glycomyces tritici TaxID=2665176 RepID=A0ABT7YWL1_9ACTN|nr:hypothetical protein [Glycomyces tritici]MDN3243015.1 hypothetical protein [Glycomyces tritici]